MSPAVRTSRVRLASLAPSGVPKGRASGPDGAGGHSTSQLSPPSARRASPAEATRTGTPAPAAVRWTRAACAGGSARAVVSTRPTERPRRTPARPPVWSAWKWVRTIRGTRLIPSTRRHRSTASGSGPVSTTTAAPGPAARTSASPWPTSQRTIRHPGGGHPVTTRVTPGGCTTNSTSSTATATATRRRPRSRRRAARTTTTVTRASSAPPPQPPGQPKPAPGSAAPVRATPAIHPAGRPAPCATSSAAPGSTGARARAAKPSTVAGATANSATRLQGTATRPTRADSTATTGAQTACAAAAAATASAIRAGTPRSRSASLQRGASSSSAPVASTDSRKP